jgi:hypothetical protein
LDPKERVERKTAVHRIKLGQLMNELTKQSGAFFRRLAQQASGEIAPTCGSDGLARIEV